MGEVLTALGEAFGYIMTPGTLLLMLLSVFIGSLVGVLPGIGPVGAMAVLLPLTFGLDPTIGVLMLAGIFFGSQYGGSTSSILMGLPGAPSAVVATIDGYEMTKKGRAGAALAVAAIGSFIAGTIAYSSVALVGAPLSDLAIQFTPTEFLALTIFALLVLSRVTGGSMAKTLLGVGIGLLLGMIGLDSMSGNLRFTFGSRHLVQGLSLVPVAVGVFGITEVLLLTQRQRRVPDLPVVRFKDLLPTRSELRRSIGPMFRGGILGFFFGVIPGPAPVASTYASYSLERALSRRKEEFGRGAIEGVAGPEAANNSAAAGGMIPVMILGIPFTAPTAMLLAGFIIHGVIPGPMLIKTSPEIFYGVIAGLFVGNAMLLILNLPLVGLFTNLLRIPRDIMLAIIVALAIIGTFAARNSIFDVALLGIMSAIGYLTVKAKIPRPALVLAFVLSDFLEYSLVQTLRLSGGDLTYILRRPVAVIILVATLLVIAKPLLWRMIQRIRGVSANKAKEQ